MLSSSCRNYSVGLFTFHLQLMSSRRCSRIYFYSKQRVDTPIFSPFPRFFLLSQCFFSFFFFESWVQRKCTCIHRHWRVMSYDRCLFIVICIVYTMYHTEFGLFVDFVFVFFLLLSSFSFVVCVQKWNAKIETEYRFFFVFIWLHALCHRLSSPQYRVEYEIPSTGYVLAICSSTRRTNPVLWHTHRSTTLTRFTKYNNMIHKLVGFINYVQWCANIWASQTCET